jgi:flavodoxin
MDVYYFTFTGNSKRIAEWIAQLGGRLKEIKTKKLPYTLWLVMSFFPYLDVKSKFEEPESNLIFLCFPKWTLNCPPVTYFLKKADLSGKTLCMVITYGGFDEKRYAEFYRHFALKRTKNVNVLLVKRRDISESEDETRKRVLEWAERFSKS